MISLRVTPQGQTDQIIGNLRRNSAQLSKFQEQVTTGKRLLRPSDGPSDTALVRASKAEDQRLESQLNNIRDALATLQTSEDGLLQVRDILTEASQTAITANDPTADSAAGTGSIVELQNLIDRLFSIANQRLPDGRYLFSGTTTDQKPFDATARDADGNPTVVTYQGSLDNVKTLVGRNQTVDTIRSGQGALEDAFKALIALRDDLSKPLSTTWTQSLRSQTLGQRITQLDLATQDALAQLGAQGVDAQNLTAIRSRGEDIQTELRKYIDELESADLPQAIIGLQTQENMYQAGLAVAARINNLSLVDFLQ